MGLNKTRTPNDPAPDWAGKTYGARIVDCIVQLTLFEIISEDEAKRLFLRVDRWERRGRTTRGQIKCYLETL